ncbi:MAG: sigma factor [Dehalococcoidales bacterium]|nr:sigma factor [Dehalococcoidales bacterium]
MGSTYFGAFEDWEIAIARKISGEFLAKHSWIKGYDFDDLVQECLIQWHLARHTYDGSKGASRRTYMANVARHRLQNILEEQLADKRGADRHTMSLDQPLSDEQVTLADFIPAPENYDFSLKLDLERTIAKLSTLQQKVCMFLWQGYNVTEIARELGKGRATIYGEINRLKKIFSDEGLDEYLK